MFLGAHIVPPFDYYQGSSLELLMSKSIKNAKTKGHLDRLADQRKNRKLIRCMKADENVASYDICPRNRTVFNAA